MHADIHFMKENLFQDILTFLSEAPWSPWKIKALCLYLRLISYTVRKTTKPLTIISEERVRINLICVYVLDSISDVLL